MCDIIVIDNDYIQLQIRTRPGRNPPAWSGVVQLALKWKPTNNILFRFEGNKRMTIDNTGSHSDDVHYSFEPNPRIPGKVIHRFQFLGAPTDNFLRVEELPFGLHNIDVVGFGATFSGSRGLLGDWDRWSKEPRLTKRDGSVYYGYDVAEVAKSWRAKAGESILKNPSNICEASYPCEAGTEIECVEDMNTFDYTVTRAREDFTCTSSCDEIDDSLLRFFCWKDQEWL